MHVPSKSNETITCFLADRNDIPRSDNTEPNLYNNDKNKNAP